MEKLYRIQIEVNANAGDEAKVSDELMEGQECDGFAILGVDRSGGNPFVILHHINLKEIAEIISASDELKKASVASLLLTSMTSITEIMRKSSQG